ncbi:hypothetical protein TSUD_293080 [Trifolium subterraneum]|uniref:Uncharacterized protein n=1 Tax=Trifolium subterraneum TaxID=3900 RepID=A0A2Z6NL09_TRISU|nr:hypothetical protein TSUD_293080 [Trifolium subterraneum]
MRPHAPPVRAGVEARHCSSSSSPIFCRNGSRRLENKSTSVAEMFSLGWGIEGEAWEWCHPLRVWEEEILGECQTLLPSLSDLTLIRVDQTAVHGGCRCLLSKQTRRGVVYLQTLRRSSQLRFEFSRMISNRWILAPFRFSGDCVWAVGSMRIVAFGSKQWSRFWWRLLDPCRCDGRGTGSSLDFECRWRRIRSIIYRGPAKDATGAPLIGSDGRPILEDYSRFPLSWRKSHYLKPASDFIYSAEELTVEELSNYEQMKVFVGSFPRKSYEDEEGNPILDESGVPLTKKAFIDTRKLLACKSASEMEACFREMSSIAAKLRKSKAAKEKRQAVVLGSSSTVAPSPRGSDMDNARGGTVVVDLDDTVANTNVDNQSRPTKVAHVGEVDASATGLTPPSSSKFMLPPAIGSPGLVKKSSVSISDAKKAIMDDMGPEALKNELTDAMRDSAKEEAALLRQSLEQAKVNHAAYREKFKLQAGLVTQLTEKEQETARLTTEKEKLEGQVKDLITERGTLEGKVKALESRSGSSSAAPDSDELVVDPNGEYRGFTRAALVSRIFELEAQQLDAAKSSFDNVVAQLMVLNPGVDLVVEGASELKEVQDGVIVSPAVEED